MYSGVLEGYRNLHTFKRNIELKDSSSGSVFGKSIITYEIYKRWDVNNLESYQGYLILMKQRIMIPNGTAYLPGPTSQTSYLNYPAMLVNKVEISVNNDAIVLLNQFFPKTLNSSVNTEISSNQGTNSSQSHQNTSGSSNTNVNSFGVSASVGLFGDLPIFSVGADYSHSWDKSKYDSVMSGRETGGSNNVGDSDSMSIKDWSSYGFPNDQSSSVQWIWGQSYPWDVILFNQSNDGNTINLPDFVVNRMLNDSLVMPPSQLSMFGLDFTMTAGWFIDFPAGISKAETLQINQTTTSFSASHQASGSGLSASLQSVTQANNCHYTSEELDLSSYALDPIAAGDETNGSPIGFTANLFTYPPVNANTRFKIISPGNTLQVTGTGFDSIMTSSFNTNPSLSISFKITDSIRQFSLLIIHWIGENSCTCKLKWRINEKWTGSLYVDTTEGEGGQNNLSTIQLRNTDFTSINFHDYLIIGMNQIDIEIEPVEVEKATSYTLFAMSISKD